MALTITDLGVVLTAVFEARTKWYNIGLALNVPVDTLDSTDGQFHNHGDKLRETLKIWLKTDTEPTWQDIVDVLKSPVVSESKLASDIKAKHYTIPEASGQTIPEVQQTEPTRGTIDSGRTKSETSLTGMAEMPPLPQLKLPDAQPASAAGSQEAEVDLARELSMPLSETTSLSPELTPDSISDTTSSFSYLNIHVGKLSSQARLALEGKLLKDSDKIMSEFGDLMHYTISSITYRVSVHELRARLSSLGTYRPTHAPVPLLRIQLDEIERAKDVSSVFCILDKYYSFFNYGIVEKLIGWFGTPEDKERLETYTENFKVFCKRRTFECPPHIFGNIIDKGKVDLIVKYEESWNPTEGCSLETVLRLRNSLGDILGVESETLYLCQIDKGCVELLFQVPSFVEEDIFPLSTEQGRSLTSVGITRITCGDHVFLKPREALVPQTSAQVATQVKKKSPETAALKAEIEELKAAQEMSLETGLTDSDYVKITKAWFLSDNKDLTIRNIKEECEIRNISVPKMSLRYTENNLRNWMIYFGVQAFNRGLVSLKRSHSLSLTDVVCHK